MCLLTVSSPFVCGFLCNQHEEMKGWGEEYTSFPTASSCAAFSVASSASRRALALVIDCCERLVSGGGKEGLRCLRVYGRGELVAEEYRVVVMVRTLFICLGVEVVRCGKILA